MVTDELWQGMRASFTAPEPGMRANRAELSGRKHRMPNWHAGPAGQEIDQLQGLGKAEAATQKV